MTQKNGQTDIEDAEYTPSPGAEDASGALALRDDGSLVVQPGTAVSLHQARVLMDLGAGKDFAYMLRPDEKLRLSHSDKSFYITKVFHTNHDEYGPGWGFECDMQGFRFSFVMGDRPQTRDEYEVIETLTNEGGKVGPVRLEQIEWKGGSPFYSIQPAEWVGDVDVLPF